LAPRIEAHPEGELQEVIPGRLDYLTKLSPAALSVAKKAFYGWDSIHLDKGMACVEKDLYGRTDADKFRRRKIRHQCLHAEAQAAVEGKVNLCGTAAPGCV